MYSPRAKYLRLQVSALKGLEVIVPHGISSSAVSRFVNEHHDWIEKRLSKPRQDPKFLGKTLEISKVENHALGHYVFTKTGSSLKIEGPFKGIISISNLYEQWLYLEARDYLIKRALHLSAEHGFKVNRVTIRRQTSRWGSCSMKRNISLNYRLMKFSPGIIDYVIFHELCHLIEMNHSKKFWENVERYVPNYKEFRRILKNPY